VGQGKEVPRQGGKKEDGLNESQLFSLSRAWALFQELATEEMKQEGIDNSGNW